MLVIKSNEKWRTCIDFTNLNKACPKDNFPLPRIDQLVDLVVGHELLSFMDAYSKYNQILMYEPNEEHTSFITNWGLYAYKVMPFGLKNAGTTYQRLVNMMFKNLIGRSMEVYMDNMLVKSKMAGDHVKHLKHVQHSMEVLDAQPPKVCLWGRVVRLGKFLCFMVNQRGIEANPKKIKALLEMSTSKKPKEVMSLVGRAITLSLFVSRVTDRCSPFLTC